MLARSTHPRRTLSPLPAVPREGASGCVIERAAADAVGLASFGELFVSSVTGQVGSRFRRADTLTLGPLTVRRPLLMEMAVSGLVRDAPGPVVGIIGFDVFRRAIIEVPALGCVLRGCSARPAALARPGRRLRSPLDFLFSHSFDSSAAAP